jgi:hypothetical protein
MILYTTYSIVEHRFHNMSVTLWEHKKNRQKKGAIAEMALPELVLGFHEGDALSLT